MTREQAIDPEAAALAALGWTLSDPDRAERLLALTGLDPAGLRAGAGSARVQAATIAFLESHEPDLLACADAIGIGPAALVRAREALER